MAISRQQLQSYYHQLLSPATFQDYCPNGLQIEGSEQINKVAFAVSASKLSVKLAVENNADALVVHHGLFWKFHGTRTLTGPFAQRVLPLVREQINLFAYHLPLDAHPDIGNAAVLGNNIGCRQQQPFGDFKGSPTGIHGLLEYPLSAENLQQKLQAVLNHDVILASENSASMISSVGIITGGANSDWKTAATQGLDAYITGEISEHDWHESQEAGIHMFAGGHHATEQFGIQALLAITREKFAVDCFYIPSNNPA